MLKFIMTKTSKRARKAVPVLALVIPFATLISVVNVAISMSTSNWLESYERVAVPNLPNGTTVIDEFMIKRTVSGLWYLCAFNLTEDQLKHGVFSVSHELMNCSTIEYFVKDRYTSDPNDSTNAIRYAVTKAGPLFVVASAMLTFAVIAAIFGYQRHRRIALFVSGILFITSGLMLLIGLVVYLSALQSEIGQKLRPRTSVDPAQFSYSYGFSFILVVVGFMATEMTGILAIFYYIYWHQLDWSQKLGTDLNTNGNGEKSGRSRSGRLNGKSVDPSFKCQSRHHPSSSKDGTKGYKMMMANDVNSKSSKVVPHHTSCTAFRMDDDKNPDFDIPFPPPPPPQTAYLSIPRDYTTLTTCSDEEGGFPPPPAGSSGSLGKKKDKDQRNTPV